MTQDWTTELENSGGTWILDTALPRSQEDIERIYLSTQQKIKLADGSNAFVTPEIKRIKEPISFTWFQSTSALRTQIETYMLNGDKLRITTHTGETFIGRFISIQRVWLVGTEPDEYDNMVTFERTE